MNIEVIFYLVVLLGPPIIALVFTGTTLSLVWIYRLGISRLEQRIIALVCALVLACAAFWVVVVLQLQALV